MDMICISDFLKNNIGETFFECDICKDSHSILENISKLNTDMIGNWLIFFVLFLIVSGLFLCCYRFIEKCSKYLLPSAIFIWIVGVIVYIFGFYNENVAGVSIVLRAVISSFKMFVLSHDLARVNSLLQNDMLYMLVFSIVHYFAAVIAFIFILKLIGFKFKSYLKIKWYKSGYRFRFIKSKEVHLFWGVNEHSLLLAESIRNEEKSEKRKKSKSIIIFVDIDIENEDNAEKKPSLTKITNTITIKDSYIQRLEDVNALVDHCYNGPDSLTDKRSEDCDNKQNSSRDKRCEDVFGALKLKDIGYIVRKVSKCKFYFLSDDEAQNISSALNLLNDKKINKSATANVEKTNASISSNDEKINKSKTDEVIEIYVHARKDANNEVFDHYSQYDDTAGRMKIKVIDSAYLSVATLKQDDNCLPVKCVKQDDIKMGFVNSPFTSLVVGFGGTGQEAFKFLYEFAAFVDSNLKKSPFKCYAVDERMDRIEGLVRKRMPEIVEDKELELKKASVNSEELWTLVDSIIGKLNYVVITLNDDKTGLSLAVNLFKYALQHRDKNLPMLKIMVRCYDHSNENRMDKVVKNLNKSIEGRNIEIQIFGKESRLYSYKTIISDAILNDAKEFHRVYENSNLTAEEQWKKRFGNEALENTIKTKNLSRYYAIYDFNRKISQNISNALHCRTKMILMGFDKTSLTDYYGYVNSRKEETTKYNCPAEAAQLLLNLAIVEHERWIASHKLMGFTYGEKTDLVKKTHKDMCPFNELKDEITKSYDCRVIDTTIKLAYNEALKEKQEVG